MRAIADVRYWRRAIAPQVMSTKATADHRRKRVRSQRAHQVGADGDSAVRSKRSTQSHFYDPDSKNICIVTLQRLNVIRSKTGAFNVFDSFQRCFFLGYARQDFSIVRTSDRFPSLRPTVYSVITLPSALQGFSRWLQNNSDKYRTVPRTTIPPVQSHIGTSSWLTLHRFAPFWLYLW